MLQYYIDLIPRENSASCGYHFFKSNFVMVCWTLELGC